MQLAAVQNTQAVNPRRQSFRRDSEGHATVRIASGKAASRVDRSIRCNVLDIHENGIRLETAEMLARDTTVILWVTLSHLPGRYFLKGNVRWVSLEESGGFHLGVELVPHRATEFASWQTIFDAPVLTDIVSAGVA